MIPRINLARSTILKLVKIKKALEKAARKKKGRPPMNASSADSDSGRLVATVLEVPIVGGVKRSSWKFFVALVLNALAVDHHPQAEDHLLQRAYAQTHQRGFRRIEE